MTIKKGFTTVSALAGEWLNDRDHRGKVEEETLYRWINTAVEQVIGTESLSFAVAIMDVRNFKGKAPKDLHSIYLAACVDDLSRAWNRERLVGYTEKLYGTECDVEVNIKCPDCDSSACSCPTPVIDVRVDEMYLRERPYLWAMTTHGYLGYSAATTDGFPVINMSPDYRIMKPRPAEDAFWNTEYFLGACAAIPGKVDAYSFEVRGDTFLTDLRDGQVYLAYLKYDKDPDGYFYVPDQHEVIQAVLAYMDERMAWRAWMKSEGNQTDRLRHLDTKREYMELMRHARGELEMPDPDKFAALVKKHWQQGVTRFHY